MQGTWTNRMRKLATLLALGVAMLATKPAAETVWNHPGVLMLRSQVQLMRGDAQDAIQLANRATAAAQKSARSTAVRI